MYRRGTLLLEHLKQHGEKEAGSPEAVAYDEYKQLYETEISCTQASRGIQYPQWHAKAQVGVIDPFVVNRMPLALQKQFRQRVYGYFALQLAVATAIVSLLIGVATDALEPIASHLLLITLGLTALTLYATHMVRYVHPRNLLCFAVFGMFFTAFLFALALYLETAIVPVVSGTLAVVMALMTCLTSVEREGETTLLTHGHACVCATAVSLLLSLGLYHLVNLLSMRAYLGAVCTSTVLIVWVAYLVSSMCQLLSPDEYPQALIFIYSDAPHLLTALFYFVSIYFFIIVDGPTTGDSEDEVDDVA